MTKFYWVLQDNFLWEKGAILQREDGDNGYRPVSGIWDTTEYNENEYISPRIIENNPTWFERVYEVNLLTKVVYETKEEAKRLLSKQYKAWRPVASWLRLGKTRSKTSKPGVATVGTKGWR